MHRANDFGGGFNPLMQCNPHVCFCHFWDDNTSCCQDKHRSNMSSNILNKRSAVAD